MGAETGIQWTDATWSPVKGCSRVSPGCKNCYAETLAGRFCGPGLPLEGFARRAPEGARWTGKVELAAERLAIPVRWQKPRRIFVNSQSDTFHEKLSNAEIAALFGVMAVCPQHTFQVLTKRAKRMREWFEWLESLDENPLDVILPHAASRFPDQERWERALREAGLEGNYPECEPEWPLKNVWLGVSVEDQQRAEERIPCLLETPAALRFLSCEPLLGPVDLTFLAWHCRDCGASIGESANAENECGWGEGGEGWEGVDWVIVGGESGSGARPLDVAWVLSIISDCRAAGASVFVKQLGSEPGFVTGSGTWFLNYHHQRDGLFIKKLKDKKGGDPNEWPEDLRVREFPSPEGNLTGGGT